MSAETLLVYNLCGLQRDNTKQWIANIEDLLQDDDEFDFCISACNLKEETKKYFKEYFKHRKVKLHFVNDILPVNVTFNFACMLHPNYKYYVYCASDIRRNAQEKIITKLKQFHIENNNAITAAYVLNDALPFTQSHYKDELKIGKNVTFKPGEAFNCHFVMFDSLIKKKTGKIMPDIFASWCTESVFFYICSALEKNMGMLNSISVSLFHPQADQDLDGNSSGFSVGKGPEHLFKSKLTVHERLMSEEAFKVGFGYEEVNDLFKHNPRMYIGSRNGNPSKLLGFIKKAIYLTDEEFNYKEIKHERTY